MAPPAVAQQTHNGYTKDTGPKTENIKNTILEDIGHTPLVRINRIAKEEGVQCEVLVKCEYRNPGGSLKDRVAMSMIRAAEEKGHLKPGMTIIEPTSGNTGISVAMAGAVLGYPTVLCLNDKMSKEKADIMASLGAIIVRSSKLPHEHSPDSHIGIAKRLNKIIPNSFILDQYYNDANPGAHYAGTAQEILDDCAGRLDMVVAGTGTCGTLVGIGRKFKEVAPSVTVVGVDPEGSMLRQDSDIAAKTTNAGLVEGIGHKFLPGVLDRSVIDKWVKIRDVESFDFARRLIRSEGLMVGGSSGAVLWAALQEAKSLPATARVVVVLADGIRNYLTHFVCNEWMDARSYPRTLPAHHKTWRSLPLAGKDAVTTLTKKNVTLGDAKTQLETAKCQYFVLQNDDGTVNGVCTLGNIDYELTSKRSVSETPLDKHIIPNVMLVKESTKVTLGDAADMIRVKPVLLVVKDTASETVSALATNDVVGVIDADFYMEQAMAQN